MKKVFGIGLNKTGTTTLATCLKMLGYKHVSVRKDLLRDFRNGDFDEIFRVADAHDSFEDWPWPLMYRELNERYGEDALFILTTRKSPEKWINSLQKYSLVTSPIRQCRKLAYGFYYPHYSMEEHLKFYEDHNAVVQEYFKEQNAWHRLRVMCWENGDGWAEICEFLGHETPDTPFPRDNAAKKGSKYALPNRALLSACSAMSAVPALRRFT